MRQLVIASLVVCIVASAAGAQESAVAAGPYSVRGAVRDSSDRPIESAIVTLYGARSSATTDRKGEFTLSGLPGGTRVFEVIALGYKPRLVAVAISGRMPSTTFVMARTAVVLDSVRTTDTPDPKIDFLQKRQNVISTAELADDALLGRNAMEAFELLRPQLFLGRPSGGGMGSEAAHRGQSYARDVAPSGKAGRSTCFGVRACDIDSQLSVSVNEGPLGSPDVLTTLSVLMIREMKYLSPIDATARFGITAGGGPVLVVYMR